MDKKEAYKIIKSEKPRDWKEFFVNERVLFDLGICYICEKSFKQTWLGNIFGYKCKKCGHKFKHYRPSFYQLIIFDEIMNRTSHSS